MMSHSCFVAGVAWISPRKPSLYSFGSMPEWSMCAWVSTTASTSDAVTGSCWFS